MRQQRFPAILGICLLAAGSTTAGESRSLSNHAFRYERHFDDSNAALDEQLFDLRSDADLRTNVADDPAHAEVLVQLRRQLTADLIRKGDPVASVADYQSRNIEGWPVRVSETLLAERPDETDRAIKLLTEQLQRVKEMLPAPAVNAVINVPIWLSAEYEGVRPTGEYHPGADWLEKHGRHPALHQCVEFTNILKFEAEIKRMPVLVLHELAHAYHDQVLGFDHEEIKAAYDRVNESGLYDAVQRSNGNIERAYAMSTPMEYFAETSEAYFGVNDFYPFNRDELIEHDPDMATLLKRLWQVTDGEQR